MQNSVRNLSRILVLAASVAACRTEEVRQKNNAGAGVGIVVDQEKYCGNNNNNGNSCRPTPTPNYPTTTPVATPDPYKPVVTATPDNGGGVTQMGKTPTANTTGGGGNGTWSSITLLGKRSDCNTGAQMEILVRNKDGAQVAVTAPRKGEVATIPNACPQGGSANVVLSVRYSNRVYSPDQTGCFIGKPIDAKTVFVGFKPSCPGGDGSTVNDIVFSAYCDSNDLTIDKLNLNNGLSLQDWIGKDGC